MSTYINVTVGKAGLSDKAKQQTDANRQAKLEADARKKAEADGKLQRDANRALQGIGPDGNPLYSAPAQALARKDEPAASRLGLNYHWFRAFFTTVKLRQDSITAASSGITISLNGYSKALNIETSNGVLYTDLDYAEATLVYPPAYPYSGFLDVSTTSTSNIYLLPATKDSCILVATYTQYACYNYMMPGRTNYQYTTSSTGTKTYAKAFLITPSTIKALQVPSSLQRPSVDFNPPTVQEYRINYLNYSVNLVWPRYANHDFEVEWLRRRTQARNALSQYGTMYWGQQLVNPELPASATDNVYNFRSGGQAGTVSDFLYDISASGPGIYSFLQNEAAIKAAITDAWNANILDSLYELESIKTYPWLEQFIAASNRAKTIYGVDRDWTDRSNLVLDLYKIKVPSRGWFNETKFDGGLSEFDLGYPPSKSAKKGWATLPLSLLELDSTLTAYAKTLVFFTPGIKPSYCRQELLSLGFSNEDLDPSRP